MDWGGGKIATPTSPVRTPNRQESLEMDSPATYFTYIPPSFSWSPCLSKFACFIAYHFTTGLSHLVFSIPIPPLTLDYCPRREFVFFFLFLGVLAHIPSCSLSTLFALIHLAPMLPVHPLATNPVPQLFITH